LGRKSINTTLCTVQFMETSEVKSMVEEEWEWEDENEEEEDWEEEW